MHSKMDPNLVESLKILKRFFDDTHRKLLNDIDETLLCLSLDHILCLFSGLKLLYEFEDQPYDSENVTNLDQSRFYYELRCLLNYAMEIKHLKLVPGEGADCNLKSSIDLGDLQGLKTLEVKIIPYDMFRGFDVLCKNLESIVCYRCHIPSIETVLYSLKHTKSKRSHNCDSNPSWPNLKILKLRNNKINTIDHTISLANNLEVLDLSYNNIRSSDANLGALPKLGSLLLDYNRLTSLPIVLSSSMSSLMQLSVSYNLLQSLEGIESLVNLKELDVSYNLIMFPDRLQHLKSLKKLEKLDVTGNPLCLDKNYKSDVIQKLHPVVIDHIILDGQKLTRKNKKLFISTLDSPSNPIPLTSHDLHTQSIISTNKKKPRIISNIPEQNNFLDDDDFMISDSFSERISVGFSRQDIIINHFQAAHQHFDPRRHGDDLEGMFRNIVREQPEATAVAMVSGVGVSASVGKEKKNEVLEVTENAYKLDKLGHHKFESSSEGGGLIIEVEAIIERSTPEKMKCKDDGSILDESLYFDAQVIFHSPSIDRHEQLVNKLRYKINLDNNDSLVCIPPSSSPSSNQLINDKTKMSDKNTAFQRPLGVPEGVERPDNGRKNTEKVTPLGRRGHRGKEEAQKATLGRSFLFGLSIEDQELLLRDLSNEDRVFNITNPSTNDNAALSCIVRDHWLFIVNGNDLPTLNVKENFDLRSLKKVTKLKGDHDRVRLDFDTLMKSRRERIFVVQGGEALVEQFVELLKQFVVVSNQKMLECLKCGNIFEDKSSSSSHSIDLHLKAKKALAEQKEKDKQICPQCSSPMVIQATRKPKSRSGQSPAAVGPSRMFDLISKQLNRKDFGQIKDMLNMSLGSSEMGFIDPTVTSDLTSSGSFNRGVSRKYIDRGFVGGDDDVQYFVDEEGQEAM